MAVSDQSTWVTRGGAPSAKFSLKFARPEAARAVGMDQSRCGLHAGIEAGTHAMKSLHDANAGNDNWGILLLDASDVFNEGDVKMMAWTVRHLWPTGSRFVFNLHRHHSKPIMHGAAAKRSFLLDCREGTS